MSWRDLFRGTGKGVCSADLVDIVSQQCGESVVEVVQGKGRPARSELFKVTANKVTVLDRGLREREQTKGVQDEGFNSI